MKNKGRKVKGVKCKNLKTERKLKSKFITNE